MGFLDKNPGGFIGASNKVGTGVSGIFNSSSAMQLKSDGEWFGKIVENGLILNINPKSKNSYEQYTSTPSLQPIDWTVGSGGTGYYAVNGDGNSRKLDTDPYGKTSIVWDVTGQDSASDADGGWNSTYNVPIDTSKLYRWSVWIRRKVIGNGTTYLGLDGLNSVGTNIGVLGRDSGSVNTNPYFTYTGWPGAANEWFLFVGHVFPAGSGTGPFHSDSGVYNSKGVKVGWGTQDFIWQTTNTHARHRAYLYYSTDTATNQQFFEPRVEVCDGTEPPIKAMLRTMPILDLSPSNNHLYLANGATYVENDGIGPSLYFDGSDDFAYTGIPTTATSNITMQGWVYVVLGRKGGFLDNGFTLGYAIGIGTDYMDNVGNDIIVLFEGVRWVDTNTSYGSNGWKFMTLSLDASGVPSVYMNGTFIGKYAGAAPGVPTGNFYVGCTYDSAAGGKRHYNGNIGQVLFYNRELTAAEVSQNFNATRNLYGV